LGMPIMIKNNEATELCITNGQECHVHGWKSLTDEVGREYLDILYVKLHKPARDIKICGLPENVVPLPSNAVPITGRMPSGEIYNITRKQVQVIQNFAMTEFNSQGRTRDYNLCSLAQARNHQNIYTALSRSSTHHGTVIMEPLSQSTIQKITCGLTGFLQQEFRELEILDEITRLRFEKQLPEDFQGITRADCLTQYFKWKGEQFLPKNVPIQLVWSATNPIESTENLNKVFEKHKRQTNKTKNSSSVYQLVDSDSYIVAPGTTEVQHRAQKHKLDNDQDNDKRHFKMRKLYLHKGQHGPIGLIWDDKNYSCAYDSLMYILGGIWSYNPMFWTNVWHNQNQFLNTFAVGLSKLSEGNESFEELRNEIRQKLHKRSKKDFPLGQSGVAIDKLANALLECNNVISSNISLCPVCGENTTEGIMSMVLNTGHMKGTVNSIIKKLQTDSSGRCNTCNQTVHRMSLFNIPPSLIADPPNLVTPKKSVRLLCTDLVTINLHLRGIVYWINGNHFVARAVTPDQHVWLNDGMVHGRQSHYEGKMTEFKSKDL
ncbi:hypothetical protein K435DRAFT_557678, partial [Dendrothele bispora CBS 962.96]